LPKMSVQGRFSNIHVSLSSDFTTKEEILQAEFFIEEKIRKFIEAYEHRSLFLFVPATPADRGRGARKQALDRRKDLGYRKTNSYKERGDANSSFHRRKFQKYEKEVADNAP